MNIWFDMDGTLADTLKGWWALTDEQWIERVKTAKGIVNLSVVARLIHKAQANGHKVGIISWLPKSGNQEVVSAKRYWLSKRLPSVQWDTIDIIPNGVPKWEGHNGILFDDNCKNREAWNEHNGNGYSERDIIAVLKAL